MPNKQLHLIIFGGQGAGKGTQAARLAGRFGLVHINTGDVFRELAEEDSKWGRRAKEVLSRGELMPDDITNHAVEAKIGELPPTVGFILDGYPRTEAQAETLHQTLQRMNRLQPKPVFIQLEVPRDELVQRLEKRGRHDDVAELIETRLRIFKEQTEPLIESVGHWAEVISINGNQSVAAVTEEIERELP